MTPRRRSWSNSSSRRPAVWNKLPPLWAGRVYRIDPNRDYGSLGSLVSRADQTIDTEQIAEHWDRIGQLYASLKTGHVTASVALKRLVGFSAKNRFYRANRDLGRIFKTEFILQYLSEPELRRRIRRGLLKVEQLHALARDVFYGRRGRINARELWEQMNTLGLIRETGFKISVNRQIRRPTKKAQVLQYAITR
jgi:TnpA family transposase